MEATAGLIGMHLGVIGGSRPDGFRENICDSLARMGHRVTHLGGIDGERDGDAWTRRLRRVLRAWVPALERRWHLRLAWRALEHECDAVISVQGDLLPAAVVALRRNRVPVGLWFPDSVASFGRQRMLAAPYTALFFKDPLLTQRCRDLLRLPAWYLPEACNPRWHRPDGDAGTRPVVAVVGNLYPSRVRLLLRLHEAGIPLLVHGPAPVPPALPPELHAGYPVFREEKSAVFRSAVAVLNNLYLAEMAGVNCRLFEATGAGAAVLCERRPVLGDLFDTGTEVVPFSDLTELVERARDLLEEPALTAKIGDAASRRAHAEHTYEHRLPRLLEKLV